MAQYLIEVDEEKITEQINGILNTILKSELNRRCSDSNEAISLAIKDLIYSHKEEIIDKVVDRASREIVKKGLPKLMAKLGE